MKCVSFQRYGYHQVRTIYPKDCTDNRRVKASGMNLSRMNISKSSNLLVKNTHKNVISGVDPKTFFEENAYDQMNHLRSQGRRFLNDDLWKNVLFWTLYSPPNPSWIRTSLFRFLLHTIYNTIHTRESSH